MNTIRSILAPTDYSATGEHAVRRAFDVARLFGARVTVAHAIPCGGAGSAAEANIAAEPLPSDLEVERRLIEGETAVLAILEEARRGYDLVVLGKRGLSPLSQLLMGSVAERVVRLSPCPVLTVPFLADREERSLAMTRVLCPIDFSDDSRVSLAHASKLARQTGAELVVLHVIEQLAYPAVYGMVSPAEGVDAAIVERVNDWIHNLIRDEVGEDVRAVARVVLGRADEAIHAEAEANHSDLIVLSPHRLAGIRHFLLGSVAQRVLLTAKRPVLTVTFGGSE